MRIVTWLEIKKAAQEAGITDEDEVSDIHCQLHHGGKTFFVMRLGNYRKLVERSDDTLEESSGCCC
jgi:hypothetical protein